MHLSIISMLFKGCKISSDFFPINIFFIDFYNYFFFANKFKEVKFQEGADAVTKPTAHVPPTPGTQAGTAPQQSTVSSTLKEKKRNRSRLARKQPWLRCDAVASLELAVR